MEHILKDEDDAYGHEIQDYFNSKVGYEILERDDGFIDISSGPEDYFLEFDKWPECEKQAIEHVGNRVVDIGVGSGRVCLYLQNKGIDCVGIDTSPLVIDTASRRGVKKTRLFSFEDIHKLDYGFDTMLMFGNNFGLMASRENARTVLGRLHSKMPDNGRILAESLDPYQTKTKEHLDFQKENLAKGRMAGQLRLRVRYRKYKTPWFDYLLVSRDEMSEILEDTGWKVSRFFGKEALYVALIVKC